MVRKASAPASGCPVPGRESPVRNLELDRLVTRVMLELGGFEAEDYEQRHRIGGPNAQPRKRNPDFQNASRRSGQAGAFDCLPAVGRPPHLQASIEGALAHLHTDPCADGFEEPYGEVQTDSQQL